LPSIINNFSISLPRGRSFLLLAQKKQNQRKRHPIARISLFSGESELATLRQRTHLSEYKNILKRDKGSFWGHSQSKGSVQFNPYT